MVKMNSEKEENSPPESSNFVKISPSTSHHSNGLNDSIVCIQNLSDVSIDLSFEEIQNKIQVLVKENMALRDMIQQNSSIMKEQYSALIKWRQQMIDNEAQYLSKYQETKQVILQLREDKKELQEKVKELEEHLNQNNQSLFMEINLLKNQLLEKEKEIIALQTMCQEHQVDDAVLVNIAPIDELQYQFESLEINHKLSTEEVDKGRIKIKRLEEEREELKKIMDELVLESKDVQNDRDRLEQDNGDLIKTENELKRKVEVANNELDKLSEAHQRLQIEKQDLMALNNDLSTQIANLKQKCSLVPRLDTGLTFDESYLHLEERANIPVDTNNPPASTNRGMSDLLIQLQEERKKIAILTSHITEQQAKIEDLQKELRRNEEKQNDSDSDKFTSIQHEAKVEKLFSHLESLNCDIQRDIQSPIESQMAADVQCLKHQVLSLVNELNESESKFMMVDKNLAKYRNRCCELEHRLTLVHDEMENLQTKDDALIDQLRLEINSMESRLVFTKQQCDSYKKALDEVRNKYEKLCKDYGDMHQNLEMQEKIKCQEGRKPVSFEWIQERKSLIEKVDNLVARLMNTEESLANKDLENQNLQKEIDTIKKQVDILPLLQAQVEVYRDDFQAERAARERKHADLEKFQEDIRQLQLRNQQLQDELNLYNQNRLQEMQLRHGDDNEVAQTSSGSAISEALPSQTYYCPKCMKAYTKLDVLERHVEECLDDENPFVM